MKLTKRSEYACLALIELTRNYKKKIIRMADIATKCDIPKKYLEQIILQLSKAGFIICKRGSGGGCELLKPPTKISVADIVRTIDGPIAPIHSVSKFFFQTTPLQKSKKLIKVMKDIRDYTAKKLEKTMFSDLV